MKAIRKSEATTAWGLCRAVIRAMRAEPARVNMNFYKKFKEVYDVGPGGPAWFTGWNHAEEPSCGTIGCFAGWLHMLADGRAGARKNPQPSYKRAYAILGNPKLRPRQAPFGGLDPEYANKSGDINYETTPGGLHVFTTDGPDLKGRPGTVEYAASVIRRIQHFMQINEAALKARQIAQPRSTKAPVARRRG